MTAHMENQTFNDHVLLMEGITVTHSNFYYAFILLILLYIATMVCNIGLLVLISTERNLHEPMYMLLCNLHVNDILGTTVIVPRLLKDIMTAASERYISYIECVVQAFGAHMYATATHTILMIMAFDRYVAICNPLRYAIIMNNRMVVKLTTSAWGVAFLLVGILLGLTIRLSRCRVVIMNPFCDNPAIFKLSCESVLINNIYGFAVTVLVVMSSISSISLTYVKIALVCLSSKNSSLNSKALTTCSTHLLVYLILLFCGLTVILLHRFPYGLLGKQASVFAVILPCLNPLIYGLQSKEIKQGIFRMFRKTKVTLCLYLNCVEDRRQYVK